MYNKTKYDTATLRRVVETAYKQVNVQGQKLQGDVAVKVLYSGVSSTFSGQMWPEFPTLQTIVGKVKKFGEGYDVVRTSVRGSYTLTSATPDGSVGWIILRVPKPTKVYGDEARWAKSKGEEVYCTILHELLHVWQYRNSELALKDWKENWKGRADTTWRMFWVGYSTPAHRNRLPYLKKPLEIHVRKVIGITPKTKTRTTAENTLGSMFVSEKERERKKKVVGPKYNRYGQRVSDYRNVKMKTLRNGDEVVLCPCCGEKSVVLDSYEDKLTYTHIAAVDGEVMKETGFTASECRYTQYGCREDGEIVRWGYVWMPDNDGCLQIFSSNPFGR